MGGTGRRRLPGRPARRSVPRIPGTGPAALRGRRERRRVRFSPRPGVTVMRDDELTGLTVARAATLLRARKVSPVELTRACLDRIERLNPTLNAFITVTADLALRQARQAEREII